jgi:small subunit ribosomal protein S20
MAHHKSAIKRIRQNEKRRMYNRYWKSTMRTAIKQVRKAVEANDLEKARIAMREATSTIDHVASKGVIHKNTASRNISRLARLVNRTQTAS